MSLESPLQISETGTLPQEEAESPDTRFPEFMWLEVTGACPLKCEHCYADSGPDGTHGTMTEKNWHGVIDDSADLGLKRVQFIGGEPTLLPALPNLIDHSLDRGLGVEVFSNMTHIRESLWKTLSQKGVSLATSFYSDNAAEHDAITKGRGSYERTKGNIEKALELGIPLRAGVIDVRDGQRADQAQTQLRNMGVERIGYDKLRQVGRGVRNIEESIGQLCGRCTVNLAVGPKGEVWPCVFSRWLVAGNVQEQPIGDIVRGPALRDIRSTLDVEFASRLNTTMDCKPANCDPYCQPQEGVCQPDCTPQLNPCTPDIPQPCDPQNCGPAH